MKKHTFFYIVSLLLVTYAVQAQDLAANDVPQAITASFSSKYPDATDIKWKKNKSGKYEADFKQNGKKAEAKFTADGTWDSADKRMEEKDLPEPVTSYLQKNYASYKIDQIEWKEDRDASKNIYEVKVKKDKAESELIFNAEGKFLKKNEKKK